MNEDLQALELVEAGDDFVDVELGVELVDVELPDVELLGTDDVELA